MSFGHSGDIWLHARVDSVNRVAHTRPNDLGVSGQKSDFLVHFTSTFVGGIVISEPLADRSEVG